jgi:hypothetical protein
VVHEVDPTSTTPWANMPGLVEDVEQYWTAISNKDPDLRIWEGRKHQQIFQIVEVIIDLLSKLHSQRFCSLSLPVG